MPGKDVIVVSIDGEQGRACRRSSTARCGATVECNPRFGPKAFDDARRTTRKGEKIPPWIINTDRFYDASNAKAELSPTRY